MNDRSKDIGEAEASKGKWSSELAIAAEAALAGGKLAASRIHGSFEQWDKQPGDPVCEIDHAVNDLLAEVLRGARPDFGWLSEESADTPERLEQETVWVIDPIDGTRAYLRGRPEYCVSIACVHAGKPVVGAVYDPSADRLYTARAGAGAFCNGTSICVSETNEALTGRLIMAEDLMRTDLWPEPWRPSERTQPNSMALRIAWVATGAHDLTLALSAKNDWDIAAADLILSEAGGLLSDENGAALVYNRPKPSHPFLVGAAPGVHAQTCAQVRGLIANYRARQASQRSSEES